MKWSRTVLSCDCHDTFHGDPPELHSFPTRRSSDLARAIVRLALSDAGGVAHVTSCDGCTWHGLAVEAIRLVGLAAAVEAVRSEEHTSELQSQFHLVCRLLLEKKQRYPRLYIFSCST